MAPSPGTACPRLRTRATYVASALAAVAVGLSVHWYGGAFSPAVRDVLGDALWAAMMLWWVSVLAPNAPLPVRAGVALGACFAVEWSQLYHSPGLDALRRTTAGGLVLGSDFDPRDLVAYTAGVLVASAIDRALGYAGSRRAPV